MEKKVMERDWVPTCFLVVHGPKQRSTIRYTPRHIQRARVVYRSKISLYGRSPVEPIWTRESPEMGLDDIFSVSSEEIAGDLKTEQLFHYGEAYNWSPEMAPPTANIAMPLHLHYSSSDGSMQGHLASFFIFGAPRSIVRGDFYYECFPSARVDRGHHLSAFIINPFLRSSSYQVRIIRADGGVWESPEMVVRGKSAARWNSRESGFGGSSEPVGVVIKSKLKTTSFFATETADGVMVGLDHGHPFLAHVLDHR